MRFGAYGEDVRLTFVALDACDIADAGIKRGASGTSGAGPRPDRNDGAGGITMGDEFHQQYRLFRGAADAHVGAAYRPSGTHKRQIAEVMDFLVTDQFFLNLAMATV